MQLLKIHAILILFFWAVGSGILLFGNENNKISNFILDIGAVLTLGAMVGAVVFVAYIIWRI